MSKTCCLLLNMKEDQGYVNPRPINDTLCQSEETRFNALYRHQKVSNMPVEAVSLTSDWLQGCISSLESFIRTESLVFIVMGCGLAGVVLVGMVVALCLCRAISPDDEDQEQES